VPQKKGKNAGSKGNLKRKEKVRGRSRKTKKWTLGTEITSNGRSKEEVPD